MRGLYALVAICVLVAAPLHVTSAENIANILDDLSITDFSTNSCRVGDSEEHSGSVSFHQPLSHQSRQSLGQALGWQLTGQLNLTGAITGTVAGSAHISPVAWTLHVSGQGTAKLEAKITITGNRRRRQTSFGYLVLGIGISASDSATLQNACVNGLAGGMNLSTPDPAFVVDYLTVKRVAYTGPLSLFRRVRAAVEAHMRASALAKASEAVKAAGSTYSSKKQELIASLVDALPPGCLCVSDTAPPVVIGTGAGAGCDVGVDDADGFSGEAPASTGSGLFN